MNLEGECRRQLHFAPCASPLPFGRSSGEGRSAACSWVALVPGRTTSPLKTHVWGSRACASGRSSRRARPSLPTATGCRRYAYKTALGRSSWPNRDPIGEQGGANLYAFVENRSTSRIDPLGRVGISYITEGAKWFPKEENFWAAVWLQFSTDDASRYGNMASALILHHSLSIQIQPCICLPSLSTSDQAWYYVGTAFGNVGEAIGIPFQLGNFAFKNLYSQLPGFDQIGASGRRQFFSTPWKSKGSLEISLEFAVQPTGYYSGAPIEGVGNGDLPGYFYPESAHHSHFATQGAEPWAWSYFAHDRQSLSLSFTWDNCGTSPKWSYTMTPAIGPGPNRPFREDPREGAIILP